MAPTGCLMSESNLAFFGFKVLRIHIPSNSKRNGLSPRDRIERSRMVAGDVTLSSPAVTGNGSSKRLTKKWFRMNPRDPSTMFPWLHGLAYSELVGTRNSFPHSATCRNKEYAIPKMVRNMTVSKHKEHILHDCAQWCSTMTAAYLQCCP